MSIHDEKTLAATWELDLDYLTVARFAELVVERASEHVAAYSWATERMTLEGLFEHALSTLRDHRERAAVLDLDTEIGDDCLAHVSLERGRLYLRVAARSVDALARAKAWLRERYPVSEPAEKQCIPVTLWSWSERGGRRSSRTIEVQSWPAIAANYPSSVASRLAALMDDGFRPQRGGQLVLWHGEPGTGKTYALRALGWEWRSWCDFHYVTDPETFFGTSPRYMLDVLLDEPDDDDRWRLLILEDTGELLASDAKERTGQGLSRLLNVVDGLIGQGLRVVVLVTTNEPLRRLHPAVSRPGRCAAQIEFVPFSRAEAAEWLEEHGAPDPGRAGTLAALFARAAGEDLPERQEIGFVR